MKLLLFSVFILSSVLGVCDGDSYWTTSWTTAYPVGPGANLKGKMVTLSQRSGVTFFQPHYRLGAQEGATARPATTNYWTTSWTTSPYPTSPSTTGVSVCLRYMSETTSITLFKLSPRSPLTFSWSNPWYSVNWGYYTQVTLNPRISLWSTVRTQPWTSVCMVVDSLKNVVQVFQNGAMSIRKILPSRMVWSGEPVLTIDGFDGQVTDLEVWDYPLEYTQVLGFMMNFGSSGSVLTWSNIGYKGYRGSVLVEDSYPQRVSEGEEEPIRSLQGRDKRLKFKKTLNGKKQRKRPML